jgi:hypothetical protein
MLDELKVRPPSQKKFAPDWLTVRGVLKGFLRHKLAYPKAHLLLDWRVVV